MRFVPPGQNIFWGETNQKKPTTWHLRPFQHQQVLSVLCTTLCPCTAGAFRFLSLFRSPCCLLCLFRSAYCLHRFFSLASCFRCLTFASCFRIRYFAFASCFPCFPSSSVFLAISCVACFLSICVPCFFSISYVHSLLSISCICMILASFPFPVLLFLSLSLSCACFRFFHSSHFLDFFVLRGFLTLRALPASLTFVRLAFLSSILLSFVAFSPAACFLSLFVCFFHSSLVFWFHSSFFFCFSRFLLHFPFLSLFLLLCNKILKNFS